MGRSSQVKSHPCKDGVIIVKGMTSTSSARSIEDKIRNNPGIKLINVSLDHEQAYVKLNPDVTSLEQVRRAINDIGFDASLYVPHENGSVAITTVEVKGMTSQSCVEIIESTIRDSPGVLALKVSLHHGQAVIQYNPALTTPDSLRNQIGGLGYDASLLSPFSGRLTCVVGVGGMTGQASVKNIEGVVAALDGVRAISVSLEDKVALVDYDTDITTAGAIAKCIDGMGFQSKLLVGEFLNTEQPMMDNILYKPDSGSSATAQCYIDIEGMNSQSCVRAIKGNMGGVMGILSCDVSLEHKHADITYIASVITPSKIVACIDSMGFSAKVSNRPSEKSSLSKHITLSIDGMTCNSCVKKIESSLIAHPGVLSVKVSLAAQRGDFGYDPSKVTSQQLAHAVTNLGFTSTVQSGLESSDVLISTDKKNACMGLSARIYPTGFCRELKSLFFLAWPLVVTFMTQSTCGLVAVMFCGRLGTYELDAVSLANSVINVLGVQIILGMTSACDTLFSQIYGSNHKHAAGVVLQTSFILFLLTMIPLLAFHINSHNLLILCGQEPVIAELVENYLFICIPGLLCYTVAISTTKFLQSQDIVIPGMIIGIIANGVNALLHYVLLFEFNMGLTGSALAQVVSHVLVAVLNIAYTLCCGGCRDTWAGWSWECLYNWGQFARLAMSGFLTTCIEWWIFEAGIFLAGIVGMTELGAQSVVFQFEILFYMLPYGVGTASAIRVGQYLGAGQGDAAKTVTHIALTLAVIIGCLYAVIFGALKDLLPVVFTTIPEVMEMASTVLPILAVYYLANSLVAITCGLLRGMGRQYFGAITVPIAYICALFIGVPLLFLTNLSIRGYWIGLSMALLFLATINVIFVITRNWDVEVKLAEARIGNVVSEDATNILTGENETGDAPSSRTPVDYRIDSPVTQRGRLPSRPLLIRRCLIAGVSVSILIVGIVCRLLFPPAHHPMAEHGPASNITMELASYTHP